MPPAPVKRSLHRSRPLAYPSPRNSFAPIALSVKREGYGQSIRAGGNPSGGLAVYLTWAANLAPCRRKLGLRAYESPMRPFARGRCHQTHGSKARPWREAFAQERALSQPLIENVGSVCLTHGRLKRLSRPDPFQCLRPNRPERARSCFKTSLTGHVGGPDWGPVHSLCKEQLEEPLRLEVLRFG